MQRLFEEIKVKYEKMKEEMIGLLDKKIIYMQLLIYSILLLYFYDIFLCYMYVLILKLCDFFFIKKVVVIKFVVLSFCVICGVLGK